MTNFDLTNFTLSPVSYPSHQIPIWSYPFTCMCMQWIEIDLPMVSQFIMATLLLICSLRAQSIHILLFQSLNNGHFENIRALLCFFQLLTGNSQQKFVNTAKKNASKLVRMQSLKVISFKLEKKQLHQILQTFVWWEQAHDPPLPLPLQLTKVCKILWLCGAIILTGF